MGNVLSVDEIGHGKRSARWPSDYNLTVDEPLRSWEHTFRVVVDSATMTQSEILQGAWGLGLPLQWQQHPFDVPAPPAQMVATDFSMTETDVPERHEVRVTFNLFVNPGDEPGLWTTTTGQSEYAVEAAYAVGGEATVDDDGNPTGAIVNAAGLPFIPPLTVPESFLVLTCEQSFLDIDEAEIVEDYLHHVNREAAFRGHAAGLVYMAEFNATPDYRQGVHFKKCRFVFHVKKRGWAQKPLNCGFEYIDPDTGNLLTATTVGGQPVSDPVLLDLDGQKLPSGAPAVFLNFDTAPSADFNDLGLSGR